MATESAPSISPADLIHFGEGMSDLEVESMAAWIVYANYHRAKEALVRKTIEIIRCPVQSQP
jgi:hypothetical protein